MCYNVCIVEKGGGSRYGKCRRKQAGAEEEKKKWTVTRGPAATKAKNEYTRKHYDRTEMILPKGIKVKLKEAAKEQGMSRNKYIVTAVKEKYMRDTGRELIPNYHGDRKSRRYL